MPADDAPGLHEAREAASPFRGGRSRGRAGPGARTVPGYTAHPPSVLVVESVQGEGAAEDVPAAPRWLLSLSGNALEAELASVCGAALGAEGKSFGLELRVQEGEAALEAVRPNPGRPFFIAISCPLHGGI